MSLYNGRLFAGKMELQTGKKISRLRSVLTGGYGPKAAAGAWFAIASGAAAVGVGTAFFVFALPLSAAFLSATLLATGVISATNAAGSIGDHNQFSQITELSQKHQELEKKVLELLEPGQGKPQEQARAPGPDPGNPAIQHKRLSPLFNVINVLEGKRGLKPRVWAGLTIATEAAAIGVGTAFFVCAWPLSAAFFAASFATTGIGSAIKAASSVSKHKHFETIKEQEEKNVELEKKIVELIEAQQTKPQAAPVPGPVKPLYKPSSP
jgi:hypothetical protein